MKLNKKGFTMVELLAVIAIISMFSTIAITSISKLLDNTEKKYYKEQEDLMIIAGRDYFNDNLGKKPQDIGEEVCVDLATLKNKNYISDIKDYNKNSCSNNGGVCARKVSTKKYIYYGYLKCAGTEYIGNSDSPPTITFSASNANVIENVKNTTKTKFSYSIHDSKNKIVSYRYIVYEGHQAYQPASHPLEIEIDSGWKSCDTYNFNGVVDLSSLDEGYKRVEIQAYNSKGKMQTKKSGVIQIKNHSLDAESNIRFTASRNPDYSTNYYKDGLTVTLSSSTDSDTVINIEVIRWDADSPSSTSQKVGYYSFVNLSKIGTFKIDLEKIPNKVYYYQIITTASDSTISYSDNKTYKTYIIDAEPPKCSTELSTYDWTPYPVVYYGYCNDNNGSGCKSDFRYTYSKDTSPREWCTETDQGIVMDRVGNYTYCSSECYFKDSIEPSYPNTYKETPNEDRYTYYTIVAKSSDSVSGIKYWKIRKNGGGYYTSCYNSDTCTYGVSINDEFTLHFSACDRAGNCSSYASYRVTKIVWPPPPPPPDPTPSESGGGE